MNSLYHDFFSTERKKWLYLGGCSRKKFFDCVRRGGVKPGAGAYRYGFNGKENDNEIKGEGNQQDYGMRIYDPRLGRFLSVDPLTKSYPMLTPYQYASNRPIDGIDLDGLEWAGVLQYLHAKAAAGKAELNKANQQQTQQVAQAQQEVSVGSLTRSAWGGFKRRYRETIDGFSSESIHNTMDNALGTAKDFGGMLVGDAESGKSFAYRVFNASMGFSNSITGPTTFFSTMPMRSLEENAEGIGYYGFDLILAYSADKFLRGPMANTTPLKVDVMGGKNGKFGWLNYDKAAVMGIADDMANFSKHFWKNEVAEMVANNPQASFLQHVTSSLQEGGTLTVRGQMGNPFFNKIWDGIAEGLDSYEVISKKQGLSTKGYTRTDGTPLKGGENSLNEIILKKKK